MKRPATKTLMVGHPVIATPLTLACASVVLAGFVEGNAGVALLTLPVLVAVLRASQQASAYRAWKAEWDALGDGPEPRAISPARVLGGMLVAVAILVAFGMRNELAYMAGYAVGWLSGEPGLLAGLGLLGIVALVQFIRRRKRRGTGSKIVTVVAKRILPMPTLADAYRALPPYCHALMRGQS